MLRRIVTLVTALVFVAPVAHVRAQSAGSAPTLVILVRHAEKANQPGDDPSISEAGQLRAKALADALSGANVTAVITSARRRTTETAMPVAQARGLTPEVISLDGGAATHLSAVVAAVHKHPGEVVLVVGHSNTIPAIVTALGGPKMQDICDGVYSTMFVMEIGGAKKEARVVRSQFGAADAAGADQCHAPGAK